MKLTSADPPFVVVVGSGGVGKTTLAAALGVRSAAAGHDTLVMTFDPSHRLKDALGVGTEARNEEVEVPLDLPGAGRLSASLLDPKQIFDGLVARYAPDDEARDRILGNRYYDNLAGNLAGILEYMAVERLYEVAVEGRYAKVILDTPPTHQALDFLEAPSRIVGFLDSGALRVAMRPWFDDAGHLRGATRWGALGRRLESFLDRIVGLDLLRDMVEFFQSFGPLYDGFRRRATEVEALLRSERTCFALVAGAGGERVPDTIFFARRLLETGYQLGPIIVNRVHPAPAVTAQDDLPAVPVDGRELLRFLGERDAGGQKELASLLPEYDLVHLPLLAREPTDLDALDRLGVELESRLGGRPVAAMRR